MKLYVERKDLKDVTLDVGGVNLALTREQVVAMLFGSEFVIVARRDLEEHAPGLLRDLIPADVAGRPAAKPVKKVPAKRGTPNRDFPNEILALLKGQPPLQSKQILAKYEVAFPGRLSKHASSPNKQMDQALRRLVQRDLVKATGAKGARVYALKVAK